MLLGKFNTEKLEGCQLVENFSKKKMIKEPKYGFQTKGIKEDFQLKIFMGRVAISFN